MLTEARFHNMTVNRNGVDQGSVSKRTVTAKGNLLVGTANSVVTNLAVGNNGEILVADSVASTGLAYKSVGVVNGLTTTGDTIYSSSGTTQARLGIGSTGQVLTVASGVPSWATPAAASDAYTSWTPTLTNITLGNGTINAKYVQIGKLVHATISFTWGSTTSSSGTWYFSFPVTCATSGSTYIGTCRLLDAGTANYPGMILVENSTSFVPLAQYAANTWVETSNVGTTTPFTWTTNDNMSASFIYEAV